MNTTVFYNTLCIHKLLPTNVTLGFWFTSWCSWRSVQKVKQSVNSTLLRAHISGKSTSSRIFNISSNLMQHFSHSKIKIVRKIYLFALCISSCLFNELLAMKALPHSLHTCGFSPVCIIVWCFTCCEVRKAVEFLNKILPLFTENRRDHFFVNRFCSMPTTTNNLWFKGFLISKPLFYEN